MKDCTTNTFELARFFLKKHAGVRFTKTPHKVDLKMQHKNTNQNSH